MLKRTACCGLPVTKAFAGILINNAGTAFPNAPCKFTVDLVQSFCNNSSGSSYLVSNTVVSDLRVHYTRNIITTEVNSDNRI